MKKTFFKAIIGAVLIANVFLYGYSDIANDYEFLKRTMPFLPETYLSRIKTAPYVGILEPERIDRSIPWSEPKNELNYSSEFWYYLELNPGKNGENLNIIREIIVFPGNKVIWVELGENGQHYKVYIPGEERAELLRNLRINRVTTRVITKSFWSGVRSFAGNFLSDNVALIILLPFTLLLFGFAIKKFFEEAANIRVKWLDRPKERFSDLGALPEAIAQGELIKDFLENPEKYFESGAMPIKGIILHGQPGTGKTLFARALAGELGIPFLPLSGADFQSMFPGVAAARVKKIFSKARKFRQSIIFIDEIDAIGRKRGTGQPTEQEDALTTILTNIQGINDENITLQNQIREFREKFPNKKLTSDIRKKLSNRVIIVAATNRYDVLDPALVRPGRFDINLAIPLPDIEGRREILAIHSRNKTLSPDVDLLKISKITPGFSGAALFDLMNKAAILSARSGKKEITLSAIEKARDDIVLKKRENGSSEKIFILSPQEKWRLAVHQSGHALSRKILMGEKAMIPISIIFGRNGYKQTLSVEELLNQKAIWLNRELYDIVGVAFGGIFAEMVVFPDAPKSTVGEEDIKRAIELVHKMVKEWGMAEEIKFAYPADEIGLVPSPERKREIEKTEEGIVIGREKRVRDICEENAILIKKCALILVEKETLEPSELNEMFKDAVNPDKKNKNSEPE